MALFQSAVKLLLDLIADESACLLSRKGSFKDEVPEIEMLSTEDAYRMAMKSMLKWVQRNMDPKKTRVFFTSMSPTHSK